MSVRVYTMSGHSRPTLLISVVAHAGDVPAIERRSWSNAGEARST